MWDSGGQSYWRISSLLFLSLVLEDLTIPASQRAKPFPTLGCKKPQRGAHSGHHSGAHPFCSASSQEGGPQDCR